MKQVERRIIGNKFCDIEVDLFEKDNGVLRLSICGTHGEVLSRVHAKSQALAYWTSYFEENPDERWKMAQKFDRQFRTPQSAARFVLETDGEFHGIDVHAEENGRVFRVDGCGQCISELTRFFPEYVQYFKYHLNDMHAECEHQEARGETWVTHPSAICPDCGYKLGSEWLKRELPPHVIEWARNFGKPVTQ